MNEEFRLIGLTGPARSGKDTVANVLEELGFARYALAAPLKKGLRVMFGLTHEHTDGSLKEAPVKALGGATPRRLMQTLGTEWARHNIHDDVWLWLAEAEWRRHQEFGAPGLVITDIRFENEAKFVRDRGGEVWHIERLDGSYSGVTDHVSENGVSGHPMDRLIRNDRTIETLKGTIRSLV